MVYTPHTWVERTGTGADKAGWLNNAETQYDNMYTKFTTTITHTDRYYSEAECEVKYFKGINDGSGSGFVCEKLDGYTAAEILSMQIAKYTITLWAGAIADIPAGWQLCNGTNGTPNLLNRIPVALGTTFNTRGATGGDYTITSAASALTIATHTITVAELPYHAHTYNDKTSAASGMTTGGGGSNTYTNTLPYAHARTSGSAVTSGNTWTGSPSAHGHTGSYVTGDATWGNNMPPYRCYAYIMKL